ncbi:MAG: cobalamin B12-binding domain-containing protein, partial [Panacagrimonas sp.]
RASVPPASGRRFPLMTEIGARWREGQMRVVHEHFASAHLRTFLGDLMTSSSVAPSGPCLIVTTPFGQNHEIGSLMVAITAMRAGWEVVYAGPSLPAEEIVHAVETRNARAVALSLCYPSDDPRIDGQLVKLRGLLGAQVPIYIGGQAAGGYTQTLNSIGARKPANLRDFSTELDALRQRLN